MLISHVKLVIIVLAAFLVMLGLLSRWNRRSLSVKIPADSKKMSKELMKEMKGTSIPDYVFTYGNGHSQMLGIMTDNNSSTYSPA